MVQLTSSNVFSAIRDNIVSLIEKNIKNPVSNSKFNTKTNIYDRQPDLKAFNFKDFPYIIVQYPQIDISTNDDFGTLDMNTKRYEWDLEIVVHATERAFGNNRNKKGAETTTDIADQLIEMFDSSQIKRYLHDQGFFFSKPDISNVSPVSQISNTLIYEFTMTFTFSNRTNIQSTKTYNI